MGLVKQKAGHSTIIGVDGDHQKISLVNETNPVYILSNN